MSREVAPSELSMILALYSEAWRLGRVADACEDRVAAGAVRRSARKIKSALAQYPIELIDYIGYPYDPGLVAEVVDIVEGNDPDVPLGRVVDAIEPTLKFDGEVVQRGQIIVSRFLPAAPLETEHP